MKKIRIRRRAPRLDVLGSAALAATLIATLVLAVPHVQAESGHNANAQDHVALDKKFKGKLPITQLTEDEAIVHALNRLAYGPRPGDVERIRQMGLEKWIEQQLHPESIDDQALNQRLQRYPTLDNVLQAAARGIPAAQPGRQAAGNHERTSPRAIEVRSSKPPNRKSSSRATTIFDKAQQQLAKLQGPNRIVAELSMAKLDRAIYSDRQLEAVMEDFWFNHFNVFANKGDDKWLLTSYERDTIRPHTMGKFQDLLVATAKSPAMLFYLDNCLSADPDRRRANGS